MSLRQPDDDATMSFGDHLEELRRRIIWAVVPALPLAIVLFFFSDMFIRVLVTPLRRVLEDRGLPPHIQALAPPEVLLIKLKLSVILAAVLLAPWILWQAWLFIRPGLYGHERRFVHFLIPGSAVLTVAAMSLLYFVMLPLVLTVLVAVGSDLDLGTGDPPRDPRIDTALDAVGTLPVVPRPPADPQPGDAWMLVPQLEVWVAVPDDTGAVELLLVPRPIPAAVTQTYRLTTYIDFVLLLLVGMVVAFQMPLVIVLLGWLGLASPAWLARQRRYALFICAILSALLTPADVVSMLAMLLPLYGLYELGILLLRIAPASKVAEGSILDRFASHKSARDKTETDKRAPDKPARAADRPSEPAQPEGSVPRSPGPPDDKDETSSDATDGKDDPA